MPYGGYVRWQVSNWNYTGNRTLRDVSVWAHSKSGNGGDDKAYGVYHEANDGTRTLHSYAEVWEPDFSVRKQWIFDGSGRATQYNVTASGDPKFQVDSTWATDANGKPNISATVTTYDPGKTYAKAKRTEQDIDVFGNMTQMRLFDWGAGTSRRVYSNTYLNAAPYASLAAGNVYIKNRLLTSSYSENGGTPVTLATNTYDNYAVGCVGLWNGCAMIATTGARQKDPAYTTEIGRASCRERV